MWPTHHNLTFLIFSMLALSPESGRLCCFSDMEMSINGGTPIAGWFLVRENSIVRNGWFSCTPIYGNPTCYSYNVLVSEHWNQKTSRPRSWRDHHAIVQQALYDLSSDFCRFMITCHLVSIMGYNIKRNQTCNLVFINLVIHTTFIILPVLWLQVGHWDSRRNRRAKWMILRYQHCSRAT